MIRTEQKPPKIDSSRDIPHCGICHVAILDQWRSQKYILTDDQELYHLPW